MRLKINNKLEFVQKFLSPISRINDLCTLKIQSNSVTNLSRTSDNSFALYANCSDIEVLDYQEDQNVSFSDIKKFIKAFDCVQSSSVELAVSKNKIEYTSPDIKFKFHLIDDNIVKSPNFTVEKINSFTYNTEFKLYPPVITSLIKSSTFITDSNKIYIQTNNSKVFGELSDKTRDNIDSFTTVLSEEYLGENVDTPLVFNFDVFRNISILKVQEMDVKLNTEKGFIAFDVKEDKYNLKYIATAMVS
jgi:hypothetical protein